MSFNQPPMGGPMPGPVPGPMPGPVPGPTAALFAAPGPQRDSRTLLATGGAVALLFLELVLLVATMVVAKSLGYLGALFGLSDAYIDAPNEFTSWDFTLCGVLVAGVVGCLATRSWGRPTVVASMAMTGYPALTNLVSNLRTGGLSGFTQGHNTWFNLVTLLEFLVTAGTLLGLLMIQLSSRSAAGVGAAGRPFAMAAPMPAQHYQPQPQMQLQPQMQPQPPVPGYAPQPFPPQAAPPQPGAPFPPGAQFPPGPAQPGAVHHGPISQPTPTQQADAYRPTAYSPRPPQPPAQPGS